MEVSVLFAPWGTRIFFCAEFAESIQLMSSFYYYKIEILALVSKIGTMEPGDYRWSGAVTNRLN
jgi:hypothetical protein